MITLEQINNDPEVQGAKSRMNNAKDKMIKACDRPEPGSFDYATERAILHWALEYKRASNAHALAVAALAR